MHFDVFTNSSCVVVVVCTRGRICLVAAPLWSSVFAISGVFAFSGDPDVGNIYFDMCQVLSCPRVMSLFIHPPIEAVRLSLWD